MHLSKTAILAGLHCKKRLFLRANHPERAVSRKSPLAESGILVGRQARKEFPEGVLVNRFDAGSDPLAQTQRLLGDNRVNTIFEAGFLHNDVEVYVDILQRDNDGWRLIEVKSSTSVKDDYIDDATIQTVVLDRLGMQIKHIEIMHLNRDFVYPGDNDYHGLFIREDITERVVPHKQFISKAIKQLGSALTEKEPERHIDGRCKNPYPCEFRSYCERSDTRYPVGWLPNAAAVIRKLHDKGIYDIRDIPVDLLSSETHLKVRHITISGKAKLDTTASDILNSLDYPRYFLDFEAINFVLPVWKGTRPAQQIPFQWSCHIQQQDGQVEHREFLDISGRDPRRQFAEALIAACGHTGPVIVYNQTFEKNVIKALASEYSDLSEPLLAINSRIFDLLPLMKKYYYHPDMKGSWSIKSILTCLLPELKYSDLGQVQDGLMAQSAYLELTQGGLAAEECDKLQQDLREYCKLDTYAMLAIIDRLCLQPKST